MFLKVRLTKYRKGCTGFSEISILQRVFKGLDVSSANAHDTKRLQNVSSAMVVGPTTVAPDTFLRLFVSWRHEKTRNRVKRNGGRSQPCQAQRWSVPTVSSATVVGHSTIAPDTVSVSWPVKEGYDSEMNPCNFNSRDRVETQFPWLRLGKA